MPLGTAFFLSRENSMKVKCVHLEIASHYDIEIEGNGCVYGVETAKSIFYKMLGKSNVEQIGLLCLDHTNKVINYSTIAIGSTEKVVTSISQIFKIALLSNTDKMIVAHNHPSGILDITSDDIKTTQKIGNIASLFHILLIDSIIINADGELISIREKIGESYNE